MKILIVFLDLKFSSTIQSFLGTMITDVYRVTVTCIWQDSHCQLYSVRLNKKEKQRGKKLAATEGNHLVLSLHLYDLVR